MANQPPKKPSEKRAYEPPRIVDTAAFETFALSCTKTGDGDTCGVPPPFGVGGTTSAS